jgi:GNAT superfamily N-acetyltransferase
MTVKIVRRTPTALEFESVLASVGFRGHDPASAELALANTLFCVCAMDEEEVIGLGRIVGDGAISLLLTNIMVRPSHQRRGIGTDIVQELLTCVEELPHRNIVLEVAPLPGSQEFYESLGFKASRGAPPGMVKWFHTSA